MKVAKSSKKIRNIIIGSFSIASSLMIVAGSVYLFISEEDVRTQNQAYIQESYEKCKRAGSLRNFMTVESSGSITFYSPNLQNTPYSTMSAMIATANACQGFRIRQIEGVCIGPGCESNRGVGIPFEFTLEQVNQGGV